MWILSLSQSSCRVLSRPGGINELFFAASHSLTFKLIKQRQEAKQLITLPRLSLENSCRTAQKLAGSVMQLMENMAATGLGADVPILTASVHTPELAESPRSDDDEDEVKRDYMAVDDDESEANCGSTWSTVEALAGGSESCEKHSTQKEMYCTGDAPELAKQELCASISTRSVDSGTSATELYKVDSISCNSSSRRLCLEWHSCGDPEEAHVLSDFPHQDETVLAAAVTTSAATIDCTTALTRKYAATQSTSDFGESTSSCISSDGSQVSGQGEEMQPTEFTQRPRGSISHCEEMNGVANEESTAVAKDEQPEKKDVLIHTVNSTENELEDDQTVEISSGEGNVREYENLGNSAQSDGREPPQESRMVRAALRVSTERLVGSEAKSESLETIKAAVTSKRKESSELQGDFAKSDICDEHVSSACTSTPAHSPQWSTHASKKKTKKSPSQPEHTRSRSLRRSPRVKTKPPELTRLERKRMANPVVLTHLDRQYGNSASSPAPSGMVFKSGGAQVTASRGEAAIHLEKCRSFGRKVSQLDEADDVEDKAPASPSAISTMQAVQTESGCDEPGVAYALVDLMGTKALAAKLKRSFQSATFSGHAPVSRFQHLIGDDVTGLRHLNVYRLLDAVNQLDGPILQLHLRWPGVRRTTGQDQVDPVSKAKARCLESSCLRFPTPRSVADQFIAPLAKELGLEYSMHQHTATLTSCPLAGAVLDWRFHQAETVVFQLRGRSTWRTKMGQVEHPRRCFHPQSWLWDDMIHIAKVHRMATVDRTSLGFLATPDEDLNVFKEHGEEVAANQQDYVLKPGSVAYLPAGAWFNVETKGPGALWIEIQLSSMTYEELALTALKHIALGDKRWRTGVQLYPGNRGQLKTTRHYMGECVVSLCDDMSKLEGGDLLPEYLGTEDMHELIARGLIHDTSTSRATRSIEVDLTNPKFKLKHEKVFKNATYRVNPVAVLMSEAEIPCFTVGDGMEHVTANDSAYERKYHALRRTPKPRSKRKEALDALTHRDKCTYVLDELFGNSGFHSQLHVTFRCSEEQSRMVEWLRCRGSEPFHLNEFSCSDFVLRQRTSSARHEENGRKLLRFFCFVGYITQVKSP